jgi:hypothetical protein
MKTYLVTVDETLVQTSVYTVEANDPVEARAKAARGETLSEDADPYGTEVVSRDVRSVQEDN